jgi:hypothetical protein
MKRISQLTLIPFLALLVLVPAAAGQSPYPSLSFARESNSEGSTDYVLKPETDEIHKRLGGEDKPYRIVGALARPSKSAAVLLFVNSQKDFQLDQQADKSVVITVDAVDIQNLKYEMAAKDDYATGKIEIGNVLIKLDDLRKIAKGGSVTLKLGAVVHQLDRDNLTALRYLVSEIEEDEKKVN